MRRCFKICMLLFVIGFTFCKNNEGKIEDGLNEVYYEGTDQLKQLVEYKNGVKNGFAKEFYRNGNLKRYQHYVNDTLNDSSIYYHNNGQISNIQFFKNKMKHGCWKDFNKEGGLVQEMNFKEGLFEGPSVKYSYRTRRVLYKVNYIKGVKEGYEEKFYSNGKPQSKVMYVNGQPCIGMEEWLENGKPVTNDIKISVTEKNEVQLNNTLKFFITLSDPKEDDEVYRVYEMKNNCLGRLFPLQKERGSHLLEFIVGKGGFVMEDVTIVAMRKTVLGNTFMKLKRFTATANHY